MASNLPPEQRSAYSVMIDSILSSSDLNTVSAKAIRKSLQEKVNYDLTPQKKEITDLIMERFDKIQRESGVIDAIPEPAPTANGAGHARTASGGYVDKMEEEEYRSPAGSNKRKVGGGETDDEDELSDVKDSPPPKKAKKVSRPETDEQIAKRMQEELNKQSGRATRGGGTKRKPVVKKEKKSKKKSAAKVRSADDSELDDSGAEKPEKERKGGFFKMLHLSEPLQALLGESQLPRTEIVKRIWAYVKERDLQQPDDKRNILCDDALRAVFKTEKVHMFTMNKILATQVYPVEEEV